MPGVLGEFAPLYRELAKLHVSAAAVDEMELWQIASMLGIVDTTTGGADRDLVAERVAYLRGRGPKPEADGPGATFVHPLHGALNQAG